MLSGVPDHVDGRMLSIAEQAGANVINADRMWHYTEGIENWNPIWSAHGIRIIPGPSSLWLDALGRRLPVPLFPGYDTLATLEHIMRTGHEHTWFILTQKIIEREFALSGSEQNPDVTGRDVRAVLRERIAAGGAGADRGVQASRPRLRRRAHAARSGARDERDHRRAAARPRRRARTRSGRATRRSPAG